MVPRRAPPLLRSGPVGSPDHRGNGGAPSQPPASPIPTGENRLRSPPLALSVWVSHGIVHIRPVCTHSAAAWDQRSAKHCPRHCCNYADNSISPTTWSSYAQLAEDLVPALAHPAFAEFDQHLEILGAQPDRSMGSARDQMSCWVSTRNAGRPCLVKTMSTPLDDSLLCCCHGCHAALSADHQALSWSIR